MENRGQKGKLDCDLYACTAVVLNNFLEAAICKLISYVCS